MRQPRVFGNGPGFKPMTMAPVMGDIVYEIIIQTDARGLMKTSITRYPVGNPPTQLQVLGMLMDAQQGQFQGMVQATSMIVDPNRKGITPNGGEEKENNDSRGGDPGKPNGA